MKFSEVTIENIKDYCRVDGSSEDTIFTTILASVKAYIKHYTGLTIEVIDTKDELTIALMILCNEMYENRQFTVSKDKVNVVVQGILDMHSINYL